MDVIGNMCYNKFYNNSIVIIINQKIKTKFKKRFLSNFLEIGHLHY
jgi:hypothetical protein